MAYSYTENVLIIIAAYDSTAARHVDTIFRQRQGVALASLMSSRDVMRKRGLCCRPVSVSVVKVRGLEGLSPLLRFEPRCNSMSPPP